MPALRDCCTGTPVGIRVAFAAMAALLLLAGCAAPGSVVVAPPTFDTATVWFHTEGDSVSLLVEVAETRSQHEAGLSGRRSLDPDAGMLFVFDAERPGDEGFWMWRTLIPLDVAYVDADGRVGAIVGMEVCGPTEDSCPNHPAGFPYSAAVEANLGWFEAHGVAPGARLVVR